MKKSAITEDTKRAILDIAWEAYASAGGEEVGQAEIAALAGVSRQTVYLAFGGRAGLLLAMLRNHDRHSPTAAKLFDAGQAAFDQPRHIIDFLGAWLDYLPEIYPVGIQLNAASLRDADAARAWDDRMKSLLLAGLKRHFARLATAGALVARWKPETAAEFAWSLVHPANWRLLVVECGWTAEQFRQNRLPLLRDMLDPENGPAR